MLDLNRIFAIISAHGDALTDEDNLTNHEQLGYLLSVNGFHIEETNSIFNDTIKKSYLVTGKPHKYGWPMNSICSTMANAYHQQSYTICDGTGQAFLMSNDGKTVFERFTNVRESKPTDTSYIYIDDKRCTLTNEDNYSDTYRH